MTGGQVNVFGILFQVLRTVEWALELRIQMIGEGDEEALRITAEPRGGGDVEVRWPYARVVQQFKTRSTGRAWSLREAISKVLPDLYLAVEQPDAGNVRYELVLDHAQAEWPQFEQFIRRLAVDPVSNDPASALDDSTKLPFFRDESLTRRQMFLRICDAVRKREEVQGESLLDTQQKLWHLLSNFYVTTTPSGFEQRDALRPLVSRYGFHGAEIEEKIDALAGGVMRHAIDGSPFAPAQLLADAGIHGIPLTDLPRLREAALQKVHRDVRRQTSFSSSTSVRSRTPRLQGRLVAYIGESGQGKTWQLVQTAIETAAEHVVIFRRASDDVEEDLQRAVQQVAVDLLKWSRHLTVDEVVAAIRALKGGTPDPWLTICLDDLPVGQLQPLGRLPLDEWGIRVLFTMAQAHAAALPEAFVTVQVENFSATEVRQFLLVHGCDAETVPPDIRETLRLPLLAGLYVEIARADQEFRPHNEYPIYDRYWARLRTAAEQPKYQSDQTRVLALARAFRDGSEYPWSLGTLDAAGVTDEARNRLESIGWLRREEHGRASIWHDRGLNWAVAESIAEDVRDQKISIADAAEMIRQSLNRDAPKVPRLGYVPLDVLWMLSHRCWADDDTLAELLEALESHDLLGTGLYAGLQSLGPEISGAIVKRAGRLPERRSDLMSAIVETLLAIHGDGELAMTKAFLSSASRPQRTLGLKLAIRRPAAALLPVLWDLRLELHARIAELAEEPAAEESAAKENRLFELHNVHDSAQLAFDALRHAVRLSPEWIEQNANRLAAEDAGAAAGLIAAVGRSQLWIATKKLLFEHLGKHDPGSLIDCIRLFRDLEEREHIDTWLRGASGFTAVRALSALVHLDAAAAVAELTTIDVLELAVSRRWWLPWLAVSHREEMCGTIAARMRANVHEVPRLAECFAGFEWALTRAVVEPMLDWLELHLAEKDVDTRRQLWAAEGVVGALSLCSDSGVRDAVRARAGTLLERYLIAACRADLSSRELEPVSKLIRRMEGAGVCELVHGIVAAEAPDVSTEWTMLCADATTKAALIARVNRLAGHPEHAAYLLQSARSLASVGGREAVIPLVMQHGGKMIEINVPPILDEHVPISDELLDPLLQALDGESRIRAIEAIGISGRRDVRERLIALAPDRELRHVVLLALRNLTRAGDEIPAHLATEADWPPSGWTIADMLARSGTEASLDLLEQFLDLGPATELRVDDYRGLLLGPHERGRRVARVLWSRYRDWPASWWRREWFEIASVLNDPEVREWFLEHAFVPGSNQAAIAHALRHYDAEKAFRAASAAFANGDEDAIKVLMRLDEAKAIDRLAAHLPRLKLSALRWEIGRQFRIAQRRERVTNAINVLIAAQSIEEQTAGYELAGWSDDDAVPDSVIRAAAFQGTNFRIVQTAIDALVRRHTSRAASTLLTDLTGATVLRVANNCEILTETVDPHLLHHADDPLGISAPLANMPLVLRRIVLASLEEQIKALETSARRRDQDRQWL